MSIQSVKIREPIYLSSSRIYDIVDCVLCTRKKSLSPSQYLRIWEEIKHTHTEKPKIFPLEYILGGSSFSGKRSCAPKGHKKWAAKTPGWVVIRLSMCSNICSYCNMSCAINMHIRRRVQEKKERLYSRKSYSN